MPIHLRDGMKEDLPHVLQLIKELAEFEREPQEVEITLEELEQDGFGEKPVFDFFVAEDTEQDKIVGLALYFYSYSTWKGKCIYLEDLIVTEAYRGQGIGKQLLDRIIQKAKDEDARRVVWQVLDWNTPAIEFYKSLGASVLSEWLTCRLVKDQIQKYN
ncbi:GNAT family N-acetyltransferase [Tunicatimonas pelagia]|uniref:GNAT family N-acetyltransferase n=1 Tax=Tunicatimonas pelagia TaxID=931531 RepID=UPI00266524D0|nr:GNAT family N-acetyltransferase [Tunicatimonas pelagia]WKN40833.1 GNAT family N-acetyltransferase [Tunicatimonas pelagia]